MGFHYTNFNAETNSWWIRRVRPIWMGAVTVGIAAVYYRYYLYGKIQANWMDYLGDEKQREMA